MAPRTNIACLGHDVRFLIGQVLRFTLNGFTMPWCPNDKFVHCLNALNKYIMKCK